MENLQKAYNDNIAELEVLLKADTPSSDDVARIKELTESVSSLGEQLEAIEKAKAAVQTPRIMKTVPVTPEVKTAAPRVHGMTIEQSERYASAEYKEAFVEYLRKGSSADAAVMKEMNGMIAVDGGYLVPAQMAELVQRQPASSALLSSVRRVSTNSNRLEVPGVAASATYANTYSSAVRVNYIDDSNTSPDAQFTSTSIPVNVVIGASDVPRAFVEDVVDIEAWLVQEFQSATEQFLQQQIVQGLGSGNKFMGLKTAAGAGVIPTVTSTVNDSFTLDDIVTMATELPAQYQANAQFLMATRHAYRTAMLLKSQDDVPLIRPGGYSASQGEFLPTTLYGHPIIFNDFVDSVENANIPMYLGDFSGYTLAQGSTMSVLVDDRTEAINDKVRFVCRTRAGGGVTEGWKFVALVVQ